MKKKYVAVMLGLMLSMSTASVYAAEEYAEEISKKADTTGFIGIQSFRSRIRKCTVI